MKKILFLTLILSAMVVTTNAQTGAGGGTVPKQTKQDPAVMLKEMKEKQAPPMVEKTGLTLAQAERVIELNFEMRQQAATALQGLSDTERSAKIAELKAAKEKKFTEFLTADQIAAVKAYYEDMGKNMQEKRSN